MPLLSQGYNIQRSPSSSTATRPTQHARPAPPRARREPGWLLIQWHRYIQKLKHFIEASHWQFRALALLSPEARAQEEARMNGPATKPHSQVWEMLGPFRVERYHLIGIELPHAAFYKTGGTQTFTVSPTTCEHPSSTLQARAAKTQAWWLCKACGSRFDRLRLDRGVTPIDAKGLEASTQAPLLPNDTTILTFGRHQGKTVRELRYHQASYCDWMVTTAVEAPDKCQEMLRQIATFLMIMASEQPEAHEVPVEQSRTEYHDLHEGDMRDEAEYPEDWQ